MEQGASWLVPRVTIAGVKLPASRALKQPEVRLDALVRAGQIALDLDPVNPSLDIASLETDFKYEGYLRRELAAVERQRRHESRAHSCRVRIRRGFLVFRGRWFSG